MLPLKKSLYLRCTSYYSATYRTVMAVGFPGGSAEKNLLANAGDMQVRSPGEGNGNPLQYSCLENPMGRGA